MKDELDFDTRPQLRELEAWLSTNQKKDLLDWVKKNHDLPDDFSWGDVEDSLGEERFLSELKKAMTTDQVEEFESDYQRLNSSHGIHFSKKDGCLVFDEEEPGHKMPYAAKTEYGTYDVYKADDVRYQTDVDEKTAKVTMRKLLGSSAFVPQKPSTKQLFDAEGNQLYNSGDELETDWDQYNADVKFVEAFTKKFGTKPTEEDYWRYQETGKITKV